MVGKWYNHMERGYIEKLLNMGIWSRFMIFTGLVLTSLVSYNMILWWVVCAGFDGTFDQTKMQYLGHYPSVLQSPLLLTGIDIIAGLGASVCFLLLMERERGPLAVLWKMLAIVNLIFAAWNIYSLM